MNFVITELHSYCLIKIVRSQGASKEPILQYMRPLIKRRTAYSNDVRYVFAV